LVVIMAFNYQVPDIGSILQTLASYVPPSSNGSVPPEPPREDRSTEIEGEYDPREPGAGGTISSSQVSGLPPSLQATPTATATRQIHPTDPHTIIAWGPALRHVTKLLAANEAVLARIRKLIDSQHSHEREWWKSREDILKRQAEREARKKEANAVL
jgi:hypothetical protein